MSRRNKFVEEDCSIPEENIVQVQHVYVVDGTCATLDDNACSTESRSREQK
jgi:hypothetical protein